LLQAPDLQKEKTAREFVLATASGQVQNERLMV
jgi:hypothetical protein